MAKYKKPRTRNHEPSVKREEKAGLSPAQLANQERAILNRSGILRPSFSEPAAPLDAATEDQVQSLEEALEPGTFLENIAPDRSFELMGRFALLQGAAISPSSGKVLDPNPKGLVGLYVSDETDRNALADHILQRNISTGIGTGQKYEVLKAYLAHRKLPKHPTFG